MTITVTMMAVAATIAVPDWSSHPIWWQLDQRQAAQHQEAFSCRNAFPSVGCCVEINSGELLAATEFRRQAVFKVI